MALADPQLMELAHRIEAGACTVCGPGYRAAADGRCLEGQSARQRARWAAMSPEERRRKRRAHGLHFKFRLTPEDYAAMLEAQGGGCAICGTAPDEHRDLDVDHDHACCNGNRSCGECVRGLLCSPCNRAVGYLRDDPALLRAAAGYLERA